MTDPLRTIKIAYVTDRSFLEPTLVSIWSLLRHLNGPAELHLWGDGLNAADWTNVRKIMSDSPQVALHCMDISSGYLEGAYGPQGYISAATMGRLYIPSKIDGYVLYIDGDTLVTGDVAPLFRLDLGKAYAGVVRDYTVAHWLADRKGRTRARDDRLTEIRRYGRSSGRRLLQRRGHAAELRRPSRRTAYAAADDGRGCGIRLQPRGSGPSKHPVPRQRRPT